MRSLTRSFAVLASAVALLAACSSSGDSSSAGTSVAASAAETTTTVVTTTSAAATTTTTVAPTSEAPATTEATTTTEAAAAPLRILVTNDDGVGAPGIDDLVQALEARGDATVTVVAPATNQSGTSDKTTEGALTVTDTTTASGHPATAVEGFPADTIVYAFSEQGADAFDLVVSGVNEGQNVGPAVTLSGTVGAARTAAKLGVPAIAASAQLVVTAEGEPPVEPDFGATTEVVMRWIDENADNLRMGTMPAYVYNVNGPSCTSGAERGVVTVPVATVTEGRDYLAPADCVTEPMGQPVDDMDGLVKGYATYTELDPATLLPAA